MMQNLDLLEKLFRAQYERGTAFNCTWNRNSPDFSIQAGIDVKIDDAIICPSWIFSKNYSERSMKGELFSIAPGTGIRQISPSKLELM
jgi:hypothetical protein